LPVERNENRASFPKYIRKRKDGAIEARGRKKQKR
jgi:hypothetical protein